MAGPEGAGAGHEPRGPGGEPAGRPAARPPRVRRIRGPGRRRAGPGPRRSERRAGASNGGLGGGREAAAPDRDARLRPPAADGPAGSGKPDRPGRGPDISAVVDRWFAENTFHSREFRDVKRLVELKRAQGLTISLALPTLNEGRTIGKIVSVLKARLVDRHPLLDEIVVIDSNSTDATVEIASSHGGPVYQHSEILSELG